MIPLAFLADLPLFSLVNEANLTNLTSASRSSGMLQTFYPAAPAGLSTVMGAGEYCQDRALRFHWATGRGRRRGGEGDRERESCNLSRSHLIPGKWAASLWPPETSFSLSPTGWLLPCVQIFLTLSAFSSMQEELCGEERRQRTEKGGENMGVTSKNKRKA